MNAGAIDLIGATAPHCLSLSLTQHHRFLIPPTPNTHNPHTQMGLGKTIQTMAFLTQLYHSPGGANRGPFLVVAPLSLVAQWQAEAATWAPDMNVLIFHGST